MEQQRFTQIEEAASSAASPAERRPAAQKTEVTAPAKGRVFRRKIDCGSSTETSAECLILRDPGNLVRNHRRPNR